MCLCRAGHPALADPVPIEQFVSSRHLAMPRQNGARERVLQDTLQRLGVTRDVAVQVPHMLAIPATLTATDLVATMACRVAREFAARHPLQVLAHPLPLPDFPVSQLWHDRTRRSPSHQWLRDTVYDLARVNACPAPPRRRAGLELAFRQLVADAEKRESSQLVVNCTGSPACEKTYCTRTSGAVPSASATAVRWARHATRRRY